MHKYFGTESFDKGLRNILNKVINSYLYNVTGIEYDYDFMVKSRKGGNSDYYDWIIEIDTDKPILYTYTYNDEYKKKKNLNGFHHSILNNEIKELINTMGVVGSGFLGNTVGIRFMNLGR